MNNTNDTINSHGHNLSYTFAITLAVYFIILAFTGIIANFVIITTILKYRNLQTTTNYFIINLAICDLLICCFTLPFDAEFLIRGYYKHGKILCGFKEVAFMFSLPSSVVNLFLLTLERFMTVTFSFKQQMLFRKQNILIMLAGVWLYTLLVALFPLFLSTDAIYVDHGVCWMTLPKEYIYYQLSANFLFPVPCIIILNLLLLRIASKHERAIRCQTTIHTSATSSKRENGKTTSSLISLLSNMKAAKTVMLLVGVFVFCWVTYITLITANIMCGICHPREVTWLANAFNYLSVALNPILYGLRSRSIRREIKRTLANYFSCLQEQNDFDEGRTYVSTIRRDSEHLLRNKHAQHSNSSIKLTVYNNNNSTNVNNVKQRSISSDIEEDNLSS